VVTVVVMGGVVECTGRVNFLLKNFVPPKIRKSRSTTFVHASYRALFVLAGRVIFRLRFAGMVASN